MNLSRALGSRLLRGSIELGHGSLAKGLIMVLGLFDEPIAQCLSVRLGNVEPFFLLMLSCDFGEVGMSISLLYQGVT